MKALRCAAAVLVASVLGGLSSAALAGVLNISFGTDDASQREAFKTLVGNFHKANPDVEVRLTLTDQAAYRRALPATLDGEAAPDVFNWPAGDDLREMALRGQLEDISDLWKANTWWNAFQSSAVTVAGRQYALPYQFYPWGMFFRHDVLDRAGVKEMPHDLSGLLTACSRLRRAGFTPIALGARDGRAVAAWFDFIDLRANGFEFHQELLDGKVSYDDTNVRRAFAMWRELIDAKCFDPDAASLDQHGAEALLYAGRAGMVLTGTPVSASFPGIVRPLIDYARFPVIDSGLPPAEPAPTDAFQIPAHAHNKADARRFLKFAAGNSEDGRLARALGSFPTNRFSAVAGSILDLSSYKVLTDAKGNLIQGYDRDVPPEMAATRRQSGKRLSLSRHARARAASPERRIMTTT